MAVKINIFKHIAHNNIKYDERISQENAYIALIMLVIIRIAFVITIILDIFSKVNFGDKVPVLYYTLLLTMSIEPFLRCLKGAYTSAIEAKVTIVSGCIAVFAPTHKLFDVIFSKPEWLSLFYV